MYKTKIGVREFKDYLRSESKRQNVKLEFRKNLRTFGMSDPNNIKKVILLKDFSSNKYLDIYKFVFLHELGHIKRTNMSSILKKMYVNEITGNYCFKNKKNLYTKLTKTDIGIVYTIFNGIEDAMIDSKLIGNNKSMACLYEKFLKFNYREKIQTINKNDYINHIGFMIKLFLTDRKYFKTFIKEFGMTKEHLDSMKFNKFLRLVKEFNINKSNSITNFKMAIRIFEKIKECDFKGIQNKTESVSLSNIL